VEWNGGLDDWLDELCVRSHELGTWIIRDLYFGIHSVTINLFKYKNLFVKTHEGALALVLFLRRLAWWVVLGSKPMDPLIF
jgi:hypothetical protein